MDPKQADKQPTTPEAAPAQQPAPAEQPQQQTATPTTDTIPTTSPANSPVQSTSATTPPAPTPPQAAEKEEKRVSLKTVLLIVVLAILAAVLLFVALKPAKKATTQNATPTPTTKPSQAHSTLTLVMADTTATPSGTGVVTKTVNVVLTTQSNKVEGVQFEIAYDPTVLTNVTVKAGDFFANPLVLLNQVDTKNGKINYALGIKPTANPITGSGTVATISYTLLPTGSASQTTLKFLPKTQVVQQGTLGSVLEKSFDLNIPVAGLTPSTANSTSSAK